MKSEDMVLLLMYKTNAILKSCGQFGGRVPLITSTDELETEAQRHELFERVEGLCESEADYESLVNLLKVWPEFTEGEALEQSVAQAH